MTAMVEEFSCANAGATACPFTVRDENEDELVSIVQQHARKFHNESLSRDEVLKFTKKE